MPRASHDDPIPLVLLESAQVIASLAVITIPLIFAIPPFSYLTKRIRTIFSDLVPYRSLIPAEPPTKKQKRQASKYSIASWAHLTLILVALGGTGIWSAVTGINLLAAIWHEKTVVDVLLSAGMAVAWLYLLVLPLHRPLTTPPWSAVLVYILLTVGGVTQIGMRSYVKTVTGHHPYWATGLWLGLQIYQTVGAIFALSILARLYLAAPAVLSRLPQLAPDDTVTLSSWISFSWMNAFIAFGNSKEMTPEDLPNLSMTMQTAVVFHRFRELKSSTLLRRILSANGIDLALDGLLTLASVIFNYAGPFFLKKILDGLTLGTTEAMSRAYVYAFLAFLASVAKAVTDLLHLWHGRRATVRIKAELIAAIYDKALRRKDASGVIDGKEKIEDEKADKKEDEEKKSNADSGKIVNLMASDTTRISNTAAAAYYIYGAPFEIVVASIFLYNILGWSAFAGMVTLVIALPLNSFVSKRYIKITQTLLKARDKRISVMTELIGAIQFIKFFAWIGQWKKRAQDARKEEMRHLVRSMINSVFFSLLWNLAPLFVTLISFYSFIFIAQRELTVSVAFTAISLFTMVRMPLNVIPTFAVFILQAHVSVKRIEDFLKEDEVPEWVSSLKRRPEAESESHSIGFKKATLQWNTGKQAEAADDKAKPKDKKSKASKAFSNGNGHTDPVSPTASGSTAVEPVPETPFQLVDLTVDFPTGKLTVVSGPTGSGKSAILTALLGEMELLQGSIHLPKQSTQVDASTGLRNSVAYCSQTPWLQQKSIKDNILFGEEFSEERYEATLEACALVPDLEMLEDGDQTEIGAKGVSLSGGQKARVALARAVYSYTQHLLLDDPLAAVDSHTAKHLTDKCLKGPLLKGRTVILVSHHVELLLPITDHIVRILDGKIDAQGSPAQLRAAGELDGLIAVEEAEVAAEEPVTSDDKEDAEVAVVQGEDGEKKSKKAKGPGKKLVQDEERPVGNVKWQTYKLYIVAATYLTWSLTIIVLIITQIFTVLERYWLKVWGEAYTTSFTSTVSSAHVMNWVHPQHYSHSELHQSQHAFHGLHLSVMARNNTASAGPITNLPSATAHPGFYLAVYAIIVIVDALLGSVSSAVGSWGSYRAAITIHNRLLNTVLRSTVRFFDTTPLGRIINRFSKDIETIDGSLNGSLMTVIIYVANLFVAIGVVAVIVPWFLVPAAIISYMYYRYTLLYLRAGRSVRRLEATLRSPIYSGFAELLDGVVSVRAFGAEERFFKILCDQVDKTQSAFYYYWMMNRWLLLRFDFLGALSVFFTTLFALSGAVKPGSAGMAVLSAQSFVSACYWVSRFWGQLEMDFNAVERVEEYLHLPQEPPAVIKGNQPPAYWPSSDSGPNFLRVEDLEIKYAPDLPTVFKGSFEIAAGEKIGLIGRTGSGKSTLAMSMLRFSEPAGGKIVLDGIDITKIGVDDLRSRITYIPQDAVLFSGTVRENLDPFNEYADDELLDALARVNLGPRDTPFTSRAPSRVPSKSRLNQLVAEDAAELGRSATGSGAESPAASSMTKAGISLTTEVSAGGANFSQGQRQLVAMARALLRRSNLIIMDEATASVDFATDEAIQAAIRSEFKSSTLLTIAHRLSSVIDYDRLLVLSDGRVAEFDTPINLLRKEESLFKSLCEKSGKYKDLYRAAEKKEAGDKRP